MKRREFLTSSAAGAGLMALGGMGAGVSRAATTLPTWVSNLPLWQWYQIPNTALSSVDPNPRPIGYTGPSSKIDTWCGATLKRSGSVYMLGAAGGHRDYAGNEVNALQLNTATPRWVQLRAPSAAGDVIDEAQFYLDKRPAATHTYYATQFVESQNRMVVMPSAGLLGLGAAVPSGWPYMGASRIFSFNLAAGDWDAPEANASYPGSGDWIACLCVKHQITDDIYYSRNGSDGWYRYRPSNNTWTRLSGTSRGSWYCASAMDPNRNRILVFGSYNGDGPEVYDLNGTRQSVSFGGLGASSLAMSGYPGAIYDEANDFYLCFFNSGGSIAVRRVNPTNWVIDTPTISGSAPSARTNGIQNSVQYVPELGGFVLANNHSGNVYFVRTSSGGQSVPPADTTPPASPTGLVVS